MSTVSGVATAAEPFDMGRVGRETFTLIRADPAGTYGLAAGLSLAPAVLSLLFAALGLTHPAAAVGAAGFGARSGGALGVGLLTGLVGLVVGVVIFGALGWGAVQQLQGRRPTIGERLSATGAVLPALIGVAVLGYIAIVVGTVFLVAPGLFLATMWVAAIVAAVVDRAGVFGSFGRSAALTKGHRWKILGLIVAFFVLAMLTGLLQVAILRIGLGFGPMGLLALTTLFSVVIGGAINAVGATGAGVVYQELRRARGEFDAGHLDAVFS